MRDYYTRGNDRMKSARVLDMKIVGDKIIWWARVGKKEWQHGVCMADTFQCQLGNGQFDLVRIDETFSRRKGQ